MRPSFGTKLYEDSISIIGWFTLSLLIGAIFLFKMKRIKMTTKVNIIYKSTKLDKLLH